MNASPQPTVVPARPATGIDRHGSVARHAGPGRRRRARRATRGSRRRACRSRGPRRGCRWTVGSSSSPGQPTNPMSTCSASSRRTGRRVVAESQEVGRDLQVARGGPPRREPLELAMAPSTSTACRRGAPAIASVSSSVSAKVVPDAPTKWSMNGWRSGWMTMSMDADGPEPTSESRQVGDPVRDRGTRGTAPGRRRRSGSRAGTATRPRPGPRHVEDATAGQDQVATEVDVAAQRPEAAACPTRGTRVVRARRAGRARPCAQREEPVVADLDDLAHLPERLDRQVAAALGVVPVRAGSGAT